MIYLDNAATTLKKPDSVIEAVVQAMKTQGNAGRGINDGSLQSSRVIYNAREAINSFINGDGPSGVAFTSNSTEALNIAIKGSFEKGDHIITTKMEHNSVLRPLYEIMEKGVEVSFIDLDENGCIDYSDVENEIRENTKGIVITHASNVTGNVIDLEKVGAISKKHNLRLIVDASQTMGSIPIDVHKMNIDILCFTGHKSLMGPQGTGGIYVREGLKVRLLKSGGSGIQTFNKLHPLEMPTHLEAGTLNSHGIAGLLAGIEFINEVGIDKIHEYEVNLARSFYDDLKDIDGLTFYGDFSSWKTNIRAPIVSLNMAGYDSGTVSDILYNDYGISIRSGGHCAPLLHESFGTVETGMVRFSFGYFNTEKEVDRAVKAIKEIYNI